jgi:hopanoid biosynthesis associated RND transporter like protein HpnN
MHEDSEQPEEAGLLPRVLAWAVGGICRHPWVVLCLTLLSCAACGAYTWNNLTYLTHRNDLISNKKEYLKRWHQYVEEFGDDDDMVVVIRGDDRQKMEKILDEMAAEIAKRPESFERLFYKVDLTPLHSRALLFLPTEQIRQVHNHVQGMSLLLEPPVLAQLNPLFGWKMLSVQQLLRESERRLEVWKHEQPNKDAEDFFKQLDSISQGASDFLESPGRYRNPWRSVLPSPPTPLPEGEGSQGGPSQEEQLAKPQYFFSGDGKLAFLLVSPVKDKDPDNFTYAQKSIDSLRELIARMKDKHGDVEIGLTGLPVLENDEMVASQNDSNFASWLALIGVALLYLVVYRGFRYPLMTVLALVVGTVWALGWLTLTVGHLNILSAAFAVMLIGMGDYGVLWVTRFGQERQAGYDIASANRQTAMHVGPSIFTAAVTTAFSFFAAMLADLKAVSELGWIAGCGVLLCALSCFVVVPALLSIFDFRVHLTQAKDEMILSMQEHQQARREWLSWLMRRPRWVLAFSAFATLVLAGFALNIEYDHNLLNLQAPQMDSVQWEKKLIEHMSDSSWYAVSWTTTPEEALALKAKYEQLPEVSTVVTVASLIPPDQDRKLDLLRDIQQRLRKLPKRGEIIEHPAANVEDVKQTGERVLKLLALRQKEKPNESMGRLQTGVARLLKTIRRQGEAPTEPGVVQASHMAPASSVQHQLRQYDEWMTRDLAEDLHRLHDVSTPTPIRLDDLPANLRERYLGKNGKWLVRIFSKGCLWDFGPLERFVQQVRTVDPEATGKPFTTLEGLKAMRNGFLWAGVYALIAMVLVLLLDFGRVKHTLVALLPLAMGMIATLGFMAMFGFSLNPANMIAFPLILGVGADNGVHVLHDFRGRDRKTRYRLTHVTGFGIMVAALTTILGFGTLMIAQHRGMASLGLILTVGVTCCMLTALVFLPALLYVMGKREKTPAVPATLPMPEREAA